MQASGAFEQAHAFISHAVDLLPALTGALRASALADQWPQGRPADAVRQDFPVCRLRLRGRATRAARRRYGWDLASRARALLSDGVNGLLNGLRPTLYWPRRCFRRPIPSTEICIWLVEACPWPHRCSAGVPRSLWWRQTSPLSWCTRSIEGRTGGLLPRQCAQKRFPNRGTRLSLELSGHQARSMDRSTAGAARAEPHDQGGLLLDDVDRSQGPRVPGRTTSGAHLVSAVPGPRSRPLRTAPLITRRISAPRISEGGT